MAGRSAETLGLYVHVPFCVRKCLYCDFASEPLPEGPNGVRWGSHPARVPSERDARGPRGEGVLGRYVAAVRAEIASRASAAGARPGATAYFGGGTPSLLPPEALAELLSALRTAFGVEPNAEVTLEANPGTVTTEPLSALREAGFNRLSLGVQSVHDEELARLGRVHSAAEAERAYQHARAAGFANIGVDLMYGLPGQTMCSWAETLETVSRWGPEHVSAYELTLEPDTPLAGQVERGEITLPGEDTVVGMYWEAQRRLRAAGYVAYEISNFARPGCECRHNLVYWRNGEYLGFGASGCSFLDGVRTANLRDARAYVAAVEAGRSPVAETESLPPERALGETLMMGLRLRRGLSLGEVRERHGTDVEARFSAELGRLEALGLVERADGRLRLTERGVLVSNEVMACFV